MEDFNYSKFMEGEFPKLKDQLPDEKKLVKHLERITSLLFDTATNLLNQQKASGDNLDPDFENIRYTIIVNFRLRILSLTKIFDEISNVDGKKIFDEGTANVIIRSLLEIYLTYFYLYPTPELLISDKELRFNLYKLSSLLHFKNYQSALIEKHGEPLENAINLNDQIQSVILEIESNPAFNNLTSRIKDAINRVKSNKQDFFSFMNFNKLIKESPLPTKFISEYYSFASSFSHSEGFSIKFSQMLHGNVENWGILNEKLKFRSLSICLYLASQFLESLLSNNESLETEDEKELELKQVFSIAIFYLTSMRLND